MMPMVYSTVFRLFASQQGSNVIRVMGGGLRYVYFNCALYKDVVQLPETLSDQDLLENIKSAQNVPSVLQIVEKYHPVMNNVHVMQALRALFTSHKSDRSSEKYNLVSSSEFVTLHKCLKTQARTLELNDIIEALKIVLYFGMPSESVIVQVLLQLIAHHVNDLNLLDIVFVDFLLDRCSNDPLKRALKKALPIVFDTHLKTKFDNDCESVQVTKLLQYAIDNNLPSQSVNFLLDHIQTNKHNIDAKSAGRIAWSILKYENLPTLAQNILHYMLQTVAFNINSIPFVEVRRTLSKLASRYSTDYPYYYHSDYFNACAKYVVQHDCGLELGSRILRILCQVNHINLDLLDYVGSEVVQNPDEFINSQPSILFSIVTGFSKANYIPSNWKFISSAVVQHRICSQEDNVALPWMKFVLELASLDCFPSHLIKRMFGESFLKQFLAKENNFLDYMQLLSLYQAVITLKPDYIDPLPPADIIQKAILRNRGNIENFPLLTALEHCLGGSSFVYTKVYTKLGHFIDHAVVIGKDGSPVSANLIKSFSSGIYVEDLEIPRDCKIILIVCLHQSCYAINCNRLKGIYALKLRTLKALDYQVLPISLETWNEQPSHEKIPYIMRAINSTHDAECTGTVDSFLMNTA